LETTKEPILLTNSLIITRCAQAKEINQSKLQIEGQNKTKKQSWFDAICMATHQNNIKVVYLFLQNENNNTLPPSNYSDHLPFSYAPVFQFASPICDTWQKRISMVKIKSKACTLLFYFSVLFQ
jgi:hypothetical protein